MGDRELGEPPRPSPCPPREQQGPGAGRRQHPQGGVARWPRGQGTQLLGRACGFRYTCRPRPSSALMRHKQYALHPIPMSKPSTPSPRPTPSGNRLPGVCPLRAPRGRSTRCQNGPSGRAAAAASLPLLTRPQLRPSHSAAPALHPAWQPPLSFHPPAPPACRALLPATPSPRRSPLLLGKPVAPAWGTGQGDAGPAKGILQPPLPFPAS